MPKGVPLTLEEQVARQHEIVDISMRIFREKGFQRTSMREIAQAAEMGKSSLYDFFKTKDEILVFALEEEMTDIIEKAQAIAGLGKPPEDRLKRIMETNLEFLKENGMLIPWLNAEAQYLDEEYQKRLQAKHYAYQDLVKSVIEEGISQGRFRKALYRNEKNAIELMKWKEIFDTMEDVLDGCEDVADLLDGLIIKNN